MKFYEVFFNIILSNSIKNKEYTIYLDYSSIYLYRMLKYVISGEREIVGEVSLMKKMKVKQNILFQRLHIFPRLYILILISLRRIIPLSSKTF
jgi:hypothetical protein